MTSDTTGTALAAASHNTRKKQKPPRLQLKAEAEGGTLSLASTEEDQEALADVLGSESKAFHDYCLTNIVNTLATVGASDLGMEVNGALAMLSAINPADELEAMLATQMVVTNHLALKSAWRTAHATTQEARQMSGNLATKFARTFTAQLEALDRHRRGGRQIVEHVHVNAGGQAVIANSVTTGGGG